MLENPELIRKRLGLLLVVRLVMILLSLLILPHEEVVWGPLVVLLVAVILNLFYFLIHSSVRRLRLFAAVQISFDVAISLTLIYLTGAVHSQYVFLLFAAVVSSGLILSLGVGIAFASASVGSLAVITVSYILFARRGWNLPFVFTSVVSPGNLLQTSSYLLADAVALYLVAILSGILAGRLRRQELVNQQVLHAMTDGVLCLDHIGKVVFANVSVARLMGVADSASLMGRFLPEALKDTHPILRQTLFGTREAQFEVSLPPSLGRGRETPVLISTSKLVDEKGRLRGVVVVLHDLSERKKMEESLKRIEKLEAISEMAAGIAHEIRNPLASIRGSAQELAGAELDREGKERLLRVVVRESDRLNRIVSEFLQYARMPRARTSRCRIKDLLSEVSTLLEKRVESPTGTGQQPDNGCSVKLLIRDDCSCRCDPEQLKQVFLNIGINALEAMENGGVLRIVVSELEAERLMRILGGLVQSPDQRFARIDFIDHGVGIKEADMPRIFDPFFTTKTQGTGLGLSIAQRIIEAHGGKIVARSREGEGSRFSVFLEAVL